MTEKKSKNKKKADKPDNSGLEVSWDRIRPEEAEIRIRRAFEMLLKDGPIDKT